MAQHSLERTTSVALKAATIAALALLDACAAQVKSTPPVDTVIQRIGCLAVLPFASHTTDHRAGDFVADMVASSIVISDRFNVVEPGEVRGMLDDRGLPLMSGDGAESARSVGAALGVDAVLAGAVQDYGSDPEAPVAFSARLVDVGSGEVAWTGSVTYRTSGGVTQPVLAQFVQDASDRLLAVLLSRRDPPSLHSSCARPKAAVLESKHVRAPAEPAALAISGPKPTLVVALQAARGAGGAPGGGVETWTRREASGLAPVESTGGGGPRSAPTSRPSGGLASTSMGSSADLGAGAIPPGPFDASASQPSATLAGLPALPPDAGGSARGSGLGATPAGGHASPATDLPLPDLPGLPGLPPDSGAPSPAPSGPDAQPLPALPPMEGTGAAPALPGLPGLPDASPGPAAPGGAGAGAGLPALPDVPELPPDAAGGGAEESALPYMPAAPEPPPKIKAKLSGKQRQLLRQLYTGTGIIRRVFDRGSTRMSGASKRAIADFAALMKAVPDLKIAFEVNTDLGPVVGDKSMKLSRDQAVALQKLLETTYPFAKGRIYFRSLGNSKPIAKDVSPRARAQNTRIEVRRVY